MGGPRKHGPVNTIKPTPGESEYLSKVSEAVKRLRKEEVSYADVETCGWKGTRNFARRLVFDLKAKGLLVKGSKKGKFKTVISEKKEEIPLEARKYLSAIDQRIRELKSKKQKIEEESKKQIEEIDSSITHWQEVKQRIAQEPRLAELFEDLKKLQ